MSEQKITPASPLTHTENSTISKKTSTAVSTDIMAVPELNPSVNMFATRSTTAISLGTYVNSTIAISPLVKALIEGGGYYNNPVEVTQSLVVIANDHQTAEWLNHRFSAAVTSKSLEVVPPLTTGYTNFFKPEGRALLTSAIKPPRDVLLLILPAIDRKGSPLHKELAHLLRAAHDRCHSIIVVFQGLVQEDAAYLTQCFKAVIKIETCEPDHGYTSAFTVVAAPGTLLAAVGKRPIIDNIRLSADGQVERSHYECVSPSAMTREVAKLVEQGMSYTEIAEQYGVNKTTIMRRMDALPFVPKGQIKRRAS